MEPFTHALEPPPGETLEAFAALCDLLSPNELEARSLLGPRAAEAPPLELATRLLDAGAATLNRNHHKAPLSHGGHVTMFPSICLMCLSALLFPCSMPVSMLPL